MRKIHVAGEQAVEQGRVPDRGLGLSETPIGNLIVFWVD